MSFRYLVRSPCQSHTLLALSWVFPVLESARGLAVLCKWKLPHMSNMCNKEDERGLEGRGAAGEGESPHGQPEGHGRLYCFSPPSQGNHRHSQKRTCEWMSQGLPGGQGHTVHRKQKELEVQLSWKSTCMACMKPWVQSAAQKQNKNYLLWFSPWEAEARG